MLPILQIGPLSLQTPGLILLAGFWLGLTLSESFATKHKRNFDAIGNLVFYSLIAALVGARLIYVLRFPAAFIESPASLISLNPGLLDPWGAVAGALITAIIYGQRAQLRLWQSLDLLTPFLAVIAIAIPLSNLASGQGFGLPAELLWSIELWGTARHPSQVYEAFAAAGIFVFIWRKLPEWLDRESWIFLNFLALSAGAKIFFEAFRADSVLLAGLRASQVIAWLTLAVGFWMLLRRQERKQR